MKLWFALVCFLFVFRMRAVGEEKVFANDAFPTKSGDLTITFIGHATLMLSWNKLVIHVDPVSRMTDYRAMPKADLILVTHDHGDHMDGAAIAAARTDKTVLLYTAKCAQQVPGGQVMKNGERRSVLGVEIEAVPAYNVVHLRPDGMPFHPRGDGNGYVLTFPGLCVYIAGDTELIPEMKTLTGIDVAFLPMNLPYTMTPEMVADCARVIVPKILYPYHYGDTDPQRLLALLQNEKRIEVRVRLLR